MSNKNPVFQQMAKQRRSAVPSYANIGGGALTQSVQSGVSAVMSKAAMEFAFVIVVALGTAAAMPSKFLSPAAIASGLLAMALSFAIAFMKRVSVPLIFLYAAIEGVFVGAVSKAYSSYYSGVVPTAVLATTATAAVIIIGVRANIIRTTSRMRRVFLYALGGYLVFSLIALAAALLGHPILQFGSVGTLVVSIFGTFMASFSFVTDVEDIQRYADSADENMQWRLAFGIMVSLIWLYVEMLRLVTNISAMNRN